MILRYTLLPVILLFPALAGCAGTPAPRGELFAAMIMTREQQASSVPTDSGILLRDPESQKWRRLGPAIQMISSAVSDPSNPQTLFLACGNGIVRSRDGGSSWRLVTGWRESDVLQIAIDPSDGNKVYAATAWGVIVSRDGGDSWTAANTGLPEYFSKGIVLDHRNPERLLLATTTGLFKSTNQASSWQRVETFPEVAVLRLRRSPSNPDFWIAGTEGKGVWISRDDGATWQPSCPDLATANMYAVAVDPADAANLIVGGWGTGVYVSNNRGEDWKHTTGKLPSPNVTALLFDENHPGRLWASTFEEGTFYTDDSGSTWHSAHLDGAYVFDLGFLLPRE